MFVLGLDIETTGFLPNGELLEISLVAWDTDSKKPLQFWNFIVNKSVPENIEKITGITQLTSSLFGMHEHQALICLDGVLKLCDWKAIVAHNGIQFDIPFLVHRANLIFPHFSSDVTYDSFFDSLSSIQLIDTRYDLPPVLPGLAKKGRKLEDYAEAASIKNPFPHRGLTDTLVMLSILQMHDIDYILDEVVHSELGYIVSDYYFPGSYGGNQVMWRRPLRKCFFEAERDILYKAKFMRTLESLEWKENL